MVLRNGFAASAAREHESQAVRPQGGHGLSSRRTSRPGFPRRLLLLGERRSTHRPGCFAHTYSSDLGSRTIAGASAQWPRAHAPGAPARNELNKQLGARC